MERHRSHLLPTGGISRAAVPPAQIPRGVRVPEPHPGRKPSTTGSTGTRRRRAGKSRPDIYEAEALRRYGVVEPNSEAAISSPHATGGDGTSYFGLQNGPGNGFSAGQGPNHDVSSRIKPGDERESYCLHSPPDTVSRDGAADVLRNDEAKTRRRSRRAPSEVHHSVRSGYPGPLSNDRFVVVARRDAVRFGQHRRCLGGEFGASLTTTCTENGAPRTSAHTQTETVDLRAATVVRLEGSLAHSSFSVRLDLRKA